jgi:hypothetical protein
MSRPFNIGQFIVCKSILRFGFTQLCFVIAAVLLTAAELNAHQLATMPLPPVVQTDRVTLSD